MIIFAFNACSSSLHIGDFPVGIIIYFTNQIAMGIIFLLERSIAVWAIHRLSVFTEICL